MAFMYSAVLYALIVGKLRSVINGYGLEHLGKQFRAELLFKSVEGFYYAGGSFVIHKAYDLITGFALRKYKQRFPGTFFTLYTVHFPMPKG